jgi:hypothetical protein
MAGPRDQECQEHASLTEPHFTTVTSRIDIPPKMHLTVLRNFIGGNHYTIALMHAYAFIYLYVPHDAYSQQNQWR